jgi:cellulose biosynthesis protein BcsQ
MIDRRRKLHRELEKDLPVMIKTLLPVSIPYASIIEQMGEKRLPVTAFAPSSDAAQAYRDLWQEIRNKLDI